MTTIESLAGVPGAADISLLANELFPDLTEGVYDVPEEDVTGAYIPAGAVPSADAATGSIPAVDIPAVGVPESASSVNYIPGAYVPVADVPGTGVTSAAVPETNTGGAGVQGSYIPGIDQYDPGVHDLAVPEVNYAGVPEEVPAYGVPSTEGTVFGAPDTIPAYGIPSEDVPVTDVPGSGYGDEFDWEQPFAYGGTGTVNKGYSPTVMSQSQAAENDRVIDAPTSLGGDSVHKGKEEDKPYSSRDESIRIGSKTLAQIRADFPILSEKIHGNPLVWLDNGATTQRPQAVIDRLSYYYEHENSNVHRGAHTLAARSTDAYEGARDIVRDFIGAPSSEEIVFVRGTTEGINLVANAYVKPLLQPGDEIIVSILEHHANIVPWQLICQETGAVIKVIPCDETGQLILHEYEKLFTQKTKFVAVTHVSNVLGTVTPVEELIAIAHRHGVRILIDGAQSVAHIPVSVSALDADFFVFSGHKIFAPTGIGVVYGKKELLESARPYQGGGNMIADVTFERTIYNPAPNKFEAGTGSIADAVGLGAALQYLMDIGMPCVYRWEHELLQYAMSEMNKVKGLHLIGTALNKASVLSFKLDGYSDEEVGKRLDSYGIAVRTGHHCAQPVLRHFGYEGSVRPTLALYNSPDDIDALVKVLRTFA